MKRKSKKDDTPIEMVIALAIGIYNYTKTKSLNKSVEKQILKKSNKWSITPLFAGYY